MTHGAISRRVAAVENWLGMTLFERHARGVRLTPDGQRFVGRIEQAFGIIDSAADQWRSPRSPQLVKLSVVPAFAKLWFFERQAAFESVAPALRIQLDIDHRNVDIAGGEADLAIRYGRGSWRQLEVKPFLPETLYPVAHPALAAQLAKQRHKRGEAALLDVPLLHDSDVTGWRAWFDALAIPLKPRAQDRRFEDYTLVLAAAEAGLGVALARVPFADTYLRRSGLVRVESPRNRLAADLLLRACKGREPARSAGADRPDAGGAAGPVVALHTQAPQFCDNSRFRRAAAPYRRPSSTVEAMCAPALPPNLSNPPDRQRSAQWLFPTSICCTPSPACSSAFWSD